MECHKNLTVVVTGFQMDGQMWSSREALVFTLFFFSHVCVTFNAY